MFTWRKLALLVGLSFGGQITVHVMLKEPRKASIVKMASRANKRFRVPSFSELEQSVDVPDRTILLLILELVTVLLFEINRTTIPYKTIQNQMRFQ